MRKGLVLSFSIFLVFLCEAAFAASPQLLIASDGKAFDRFGHDVATSGNLLVVSAATAGVNGTPSQGAVYVFRHKGDRWIEAAKLTADDGTQSDVFGASVALMGNTLFVGATNEMVNGVEGAGAVYVFQRRGNGWVQTGKMLPPVPEYAANFGSNIAADGRTLLVAADRETTNAGFQTGAVHVYERHGRNWQYVTRLEPRTPARLHQFGLGLDIDDGVIVVSRMEWIYGGELHIYEKTRAGWQLAARRSPGFEETGAAAGWNASVENGVAFMTAHDDTLPGHPRWSGLVYGYQRTSDGWAEEPFIVRSPTESYNGYFGRAMALEDGLLAVSEGWERVHLFERQRDDSWLPLAQLQNPSPLASGFGVEIALSRKIVVVPNSELRVDGNTWQGGVYVYDRKNL